MKSYMQMFSSNYLFSSIKPTKPQFIDEVTSPSQVWKNRNETCLVCIYLPRQTTKIYRNENLCFVIEINSFYLILQLEPDLQNHITALSQPNEIFFKSCKTFLRLLKVDCFFLRSAPKISRFCFSV
jgi:hypothetical protein